MLTIAEVQRAAKSDIDTSEPVVETITTPITHCRAYHNGQPKILQEPHEQDRVGLAETGTGLIAMNPKKRKPKGRGPRQPMQVKRPKEMYLRRHPSSDESWEHNLRRLGPENIDDKMKILLIIIGWPADMAETIARNIAHCVQDEAARAPKGTNGNIAVECMGADTAFRQMPGGHRNTGLNVIMMSAPDVAERQAEKTWLWLLDIALPVIAARVGRTRTYVEKNDEGARDYARAWGFPTAVRH